MNVFNPPGWGVEVHILEIQRNWQQLYPSQVKDKNVLSVTEAEEVTIYFQKYKTSKFFGLYEQTLKVRQSGRMTETSNCCIIPYAVIILL